MYLPSSQDLLVLSFLLHLALIQNNLSVFIAGLPSDLYSKQQLLTGINKIVLDVQVTSPCLPQVCDTGVFTLVVHAGVTAQHSPAL